MTEKQSSAFDTTNYSGEKNKHSDFKTKAFPLRISQRGVNQSGKH